MARGLLQSGRMKRNLPAKKLSLDRTTLRPLTRAQLRDAQGGMMSTLSPPFMTWLLRSIAEGCGSNPVSDDGGGTTQTFSG